MLSSFVGQLSLLSCLGRAAWLVTALAEIEQLLLLRLYRIHLIKIKKIKLPNILSANCNKNTLIFSMTWATKTGGHLLSTSGLNEQIYSRIDKKGS